MRRTGRDGGRVGHLASSSSSSSSGWTSSDHTSNYYSSGRIASTTCDAGRMVHVCRCRVWCGLFG